MDSKFLIETNIFAKSIMSGIKAKTLWESIDTVKMTGTYETGGHTYVLNFLVTANLSDMIEANSKQFDFAKKEIVSKDLDEVADDIIDNFYNEKDLDAALWVELRKIDDVGSVDFDVTQRTSLMNMTGIEDLKQRLTAMQFDVIVKVKIVPDWKTKEKIEKAVEKVLTNKMV